MLKPITHVQKGIYRHYKGNYYEVIDTARSSETLEDLVIYRALYGDFDLWVRPRTMFQEVGEFEGKMQPRFAFVCEQSSEEFLKHI